MGGSATVDGFKTRRSAEHQNEPRSEISNTSLNPTPISLKMHQGERSQYSEQEDYNLETDCRGCACVILNAPGSTD